MLRLKNENPNWLYAEYGMEFAKKRFPLGGINRQDVFEKKSDEIIPQLQILDNLRKEYNKSVKNPQNINAYIAKLKGGFCGELSNLIRHGILAKFPHACVEVVTFDIHECILIGRKRGNPKDINTWFDEKNPPIILDYWAGKMYELSELEAMKKVPAIPLYNFGGTVGLTLMALT